MARSSSEVDCERCQHFRPQTSFVDAWKRFDTNAPTVQVMRSLQEVRKAETETLENEAELLFELVRGDERLWPDPPRFAPMCAVASTRQVATLKNRTLDCPDFEPANGRENRSCATCSFVSPPVARVGENQRQMYAAMGEGERNSVRQENKDKRDADGAAQGLELEQAYFGDGKLPVVVFLSTCGVRTSNGARFVVPFCNTRGDCEDHSAHLKVPKELLERRDEELDRAALDTAIDLASRVAATGLNNLTKFLADATTVARGAPERGIGPWLAALVLPRFAGLLGGDGPRHAESLRAVGGRTMLLPAIAGVDAVEWGLLARMSQKTSDGARQAANAIVQQVAEFLIAVVHPMHGAHAIQSMIELLKTPDLFSTETTESIHPFVRRLAVTRDELIVAARSDLFSYYERLAGRLSYAVTYWLRAKPSEAEKMASMLGEAFARMIREEQARKVIDARTIGSRILQTLANIDHPSLNIENEMAYLRKENEVAIARDKQEHERVMNEIMNVVKRMTGGSSTPEFPLAKLFGMGESSMAKNAVNEMYQQIERVEIPRRALLIALMFLRGRMPTTPSAIDVLQRPPTTWTPETPEQALAEPVGRNIEALYPPADERAAAVMRWRRQWAPAILPLPTAS